MDLENKTTTSPEPSAGGVGLTYGQRALWFLDRLAPGNAAYVIAGAARVLGRIDPTALRRAAAALAARHPALRSTFHDTPDGPVQRVGEEAAVDIVDEEAPGLAGEALLYRLSEIAFRPFDLERGPLLRIGHVRSAEGPVLAVSVHHIVADFWSLAVLLRDLGALYGRELGLATELPPPPAVDPEEIVRREALSLAGERAETLLAWWRETLHGFPLALDLPTDRPRPAAQSFRGAARTLRLDACVTDALRRLTRKRGATLYMGLLAAFEVLLTRHSGQERLLVGCPTTGRGDAALAGVVGYLVNPVAIPGDLTGDPSFAELLGRVRAAAQAAFAHRELPLPLLAERLEPERDPSRSPLFQALFVLQKGRREGEEGLAALSVGEPGVRLDLGPLALESLALPEPGAPFDLQVMLAETARGLASRWVYDRDLFEPATIERMAGQLGNLLAAWAAEPAAILATRVSALPLASPAERAQLLGEWADGGALAVPGGCLHEQVFARAARMPEAVAVVDGNHRVSYGELARRARRIASHLRAAGIGPESRVGLSTRRTAEMVMALLGILATGGAYVPLDPAYPVERLALMLADSGAPLVLTGGAGEEGRLPAGTRTLRLADLLAAPPPVALERVPPTPENLAYLIYTSGSTGRPKAVAIPHARAVARIAWAAEDFSPAELAGVLAATSIAFDLSVFELFVPLSLGATVILAANALALPELPARSAVTLVNTVPSAMAELVRAGALPASVRTVNLAGEPLPRSLAREVYAAGVERLWNLYGPSEDTTYSTKATVGPNDPREPAIGRPLPGGRAYVVGTGPEPSPLGVPGELWLGGAGLSRGYLGRPEQTAERFVPDPFCGEPGARLYKTGDLVRFRPDGLLAFLGRLDHQVKVRGFRIELGEVEAALATLPGVREAAVLALGTPPAGLRLVAYAAGEGLDPERLRAGLAAQLPPYMVPSAFILLPALPLSPNGKIDRKSLSKIEPRSEPEGTAGEGGVGEPRTATEAALAAIWREVLGRERIATGDDFFRSGGHSLLAAQVLSRVRRTLGVDLPLRKLFEAPTLAALAREIDSARRSATGAPPLVPRPRSPRFDGRCELPLSFAEERLWFLDRLEPGSPLYNLPGAVRLHGPLRVPSLAVALSHLVRRHESLRTTFEATEAGPVQVIAPAIQPALPVVDLSDLPGEPGEAERRRLSLEESRRPFDLVAGPLLRATLVRMGGSDHVLLLTLHHVVGDGWSVGVLLRDLSALYRESVGLPSPLPALAVQYADYALWQREWLAGEVLAAQLAWWRQRLAGAPDLLDLPADRPRPAVQSFRGGSLPVSLSGAAASGVSALARSAGATPFMVLLAAWESLLGRYTGARDLTVGAPVANRTLREVEELIGFFVNTLVLRADLGGDPTFGELLGRTREMALGAFAYQDVPFERLVEELAPGRSLSHTPLFQVALALQNTPEGALALPDLEVERLDQAAGGEGNGTAKFDLLLSLEEGRAGFGGFLEYSSDLFDRATAARLCGHFAILLSGAVAGPASRLSELPLLSAAEREQLTGEWAGVACPYPRESTVHALFAEQAAAVPEAVALVAGTEHLTYGELQFRAAHLAGLLAGLGAGPEVAVALSLLRSPAALVATLAVLQAGGAYLPLDPSYPAERLVFMLAEGRVKVLLATAAEAGRLPAGTGLRTLLLEADGRPLAGQALPAPLPLPGEAVDALGLAYVMFTSGSTGKPKGVAVVHRGVVRLVRETDFARFGPGEVFLQLAPASFDASTLEIWGALLNGGRLVLAPPETPTLAGLGELLARHGVTTLWLTAGLFHQMAEENLRGLAPVRQLLAGGDALSPAHALKVARELPGTRLIDGYGPTEGTTFTCCGPVEAERLARSGGPVPIGRPIANTRVAVVDPEGRLTPVGVPGELVVGGDGLARGYLNRPDLTADRFRPDPESAFGERLYRTGDLVRFRPGGEIEFLGRIDRQVKIRGFRIEPGEIEAVLATHPAVGQAAVLVREDRPGDRRLTAYAAARPGAALDAPSLKAHLKERLPDYMVPAAFVLLPSLPLTPNGKVDRQALAAVAPAASEAAGEPDRYVAPGTPTERLLAGIWAELLGLPRVGVEDNFFELGGHSLLATRVVSRLAKELGVELPIRTLFESPTVAGLAARLAEARPAASPGPAPLQRKGPPSRRSPLSFAQERLWFLDRLEPESAAYDIPVALRLRGSLDVAALAAALAAVVSRHETLRTTFAEGPEGPLQEIAPAGPPEAIPLLDLSRLPAAAGEAAAVALARAAARRPFDLAQGPLLRVSLLRVAAADHLLVLNVHHIVADGWSLGVVLRELSEIYGALKAGREPALPALSLQYADYAAWQRRWLAGEELASQLAWWRERLAGVPPILELPLDRPRPPLRSLAGGSFPVRLPELLGARLAALGRTREASPFMVLLAAFSALLSHHAGQERLAVGAPVANRTRREVEGVVGLFVNTLAVPVDLSGDPSFSALLAQVRETTLGAYAHQDVPFERLVSELAPERNLAHSPLFQVMLALENTGLRVPGLPGLATEVVELPSGAEKFDLTLQLAAGPDGFAGSLSYSLALFDRPTVERWWGHFLTLADAAAREPERPLSELPLLAEPERAQLLVEWAGEERAYPREATVHGLFGGQAAATPDAVAVVLGAEQLTYGELQARAAHLAGLLSALGVGPEVLVALALPRSLALGVATVAILQAGGAYLPLDTSYPEERLAFMLADGRVSVLVATPGEAERLPVTPGVRRLLLAEDGRPLAGQALPAPLPPRGGEVDATGLVYIMFTSGSTGRPKGVAVVHRGVVRLVREADYARFGPEEVFLQLAPASFDLETFELWGPLLHGGRLVLAPPETPSLSELGDLLARHGVTTLWLTAGLFHQMVEENLAGLAPVRQLLAGGDALSPVHLLRAARGLPGTRLIDGYGPTEGTTFTACWTVDPGRVEASPGPVPIGRPIANTRVYLLDPAGWPAPIGVPGELVTAGDGLARGYLHRPDLTADRFRPDPFGPPGSRLYRTGDLARFLPRGEIQFLGRLDTQVKIRGFRIEPGEIEAVLADHPEVAQAAVLVRADQQDKRLVAYASPRPGAALAVDDLREHLRGRLPAYMVPAAFLLLPVLPLSPNGKVDRRALSGISPEPAGRAGRYSPPRTPTEALLARIWAELLDVPRVGRDDRFFDLGGHSLLATRVVARLRRELGVELPVRVLFEAPTVAELAHRLSVAGLDATAGPVPRSPGEGPLPLSFEQERLWFLDRLAPGSALYNLHAALRLEGALAVPALAAALTAVVARHEALRTTFAPGPSQVVVPPAPVPLPVIDLAGLPPSRRAAAALALSEEEAVRPFDLARGPLLRARLVRLGPETHLLVLNLHHIVADGWSMGILVREVGAAYGALREGRPPALPELPVQYPDFALWQRRRLDRETQLAWWQKHLAGAPDLLDLPADHPRPATPSFRGAAVPLILPPEVAAGVARLARELAATPFMVLFAALATVLGRHAGRDDLVLGSVLAQRTRREVEGLIGFFVNTLPLRADLKGDPTVEELLDRAREAALGAFAHQETPLSWLVEERATGRSLAASPLFQVVLALQTAPSAPLALPGLAIDLLPTLHPTAKFDLTFDLAPVGETFGGVVEYARDLFEEITVRRLAGHFVTLLAGLAELVDIADIAAVPEGLALRAAELPMLGAAERVQLLGEWGSAGEARVGLPVHEEFAAWARRTPEAIAVVAPGATLNYGEAWTCANRLARRLREAGVGPEVRVPVAASGGPLRVVGALAVLQAGGAYVPLDPEIPEERLAFLLADCAAPVALAEGELAAKLAAAGAPVVLRLDDLSPDGEATPPLSAVPVRPQNLAYVVYTSGSTGQPKGVEIPHAGLTNLVLWHRARYGVTAADRATLVANPAFDAAVWETWPYLTAGASLAVPPREVRLVPAALARWLAESAVTLAFLPTPLAEALLGAVESGEVESPARLRALLVGGDRLHRSPAPGLPFALVNHYGPSEASVASTAEPVPPGAPGAPAIGRPLDGLRVRVVGLAGEPAPVGVPGELQVAGVGLARGYLGRPDLTAAAFVPDPFSGLPGERAYRTGDLVRWHPDGRLDFLGRIDHQVKVRGFRIELGEIEAALLALPGVREAAVLAREERPGDARLVAYVALAATPPGEEAPTAATLRAALAPRLPAHMVPGAFVFLPALPLSANGKADRKALAALAPEPSPEAEGIPPSGPFEEAVAAAFKAVLGRQRIWAEDDFFELGGHSLLATQAISRLSAALGVEVPLSALFEHTTVRGLAAAVADAELGAAPPAYRVLAPPRGEELPLSFAQERLWFLDQLDPGSPVYNVPTLVQLRGRLHPAAFAAAFEEVARRHEALRTTFVRRGDRPVQVIAPELRVALPVVDLTGLPAARREAESRALLKAAARLPFDLARGPLLRVVLFRREPEFHAALLSLHHIVCDGWSMGVLVREVAALYAAALSGRPSPLPPLLWQYADFALWQRQVLAGPELSRQLGWWSEKLAGAPEALDLPTDRPRPAVQTHRGGRVPVPLPEALAATVESRSREAGATPFMIFLAAFQALLSRLSGQEDVTVGTPIAGRRLSEVEGMIGFFVNTLALRLDLSGRPAFRELLARTRDFTLAAYEHQDLPFERLVEALRPERQLARTPLFQVMFVLQNAPGSLVTLPGLALSAAPIEADVARFDMTFGVREVDGQLSGGIEFNRDLFDPPTVSRFAQGFVTLLEAALDDPERELAALPLLSAAELHQSLHEWNDLRESYPPEGFVHERIAARAAAHPEATALRLDGQTMTYGELRERSGRIARHLRALGVGPDRRVGIAAERSFALVAALLGIWEAGGAYVPLDPTLPPERLSFLIEDAGARIVLTQAALAPALPDGAGRKLPLEEIWDREPEHPAPPASPASPEQAAYLIYTSGSTGKPKGVVVSHRALANRLFFAAELDLAPGTGFLHKTSINFDPSISEIFTPLLVGGPVILARSGGEREPEYLSGLLREHRLPAASFTVTMLGALLAEGNALADCPDLQVMLVGGEAMPLDLPARFHAQSRAALLNRYGPTETTISVTSWLCQDREPSQTVPIGRPIAGAAIYLLDRDLQPVPIGVPGELTIAGICLARGYHERPEATAEKFVPHPFAGDRGEPGERLYRSGDLARFRTDGAIEFVGRTDSQVKIRGFRVELGEIERALSRHPGLAEVAVVDRQDPFSGSKRLVAYYVTRPEAPPTVRELQDFLAVHLPVYMIPAAFVRLDALPVTPTGKADRKALPDPGFAPSGLESGEAGWEAPRTPLTPIEEMLAGIWTELLDAPRVSRGDSFFDLGGHSLLATRLVSRLRDALGVELPVKAVFEAPTLAGLAELVETARREAEPGRAAPPLLPVPRTRDLPLSFAQERLWFLEQLDPGSAAYNLPAAVRFRGRLSLPALAGALQAIVDRHESLRTRFVAVEGRPAQAIVPEASLALPEADLGTLPEVAREEEVRRLARAFARAPFDLEAGPLVRATLLRLAGEEHALFVGFHHIVSDGWSMGVFVRELGALYAALVEGRPSPLLPLPIQYADFAVWQRGWLSGEVLAAEIAGWRERLAGAPAALDLPTDRPRPAVQRFRGGSAPFQLPASESADLAALCRRLGVTPFMALLAGFATLLGRWSGQDDLVVGSAVANRTRREVEGLIGFFVNSLALRVDLGGEPTFAALLARVREQSLAAYAHQDLPFEKLVLALAPERSLARSPLFQVFLILQNAPFPPLRLPGLEVEPVEGETGAAKFDLTLALAFGSGGALVGTWEYDRDLFDPATVARLGDQLARLLAAAVARPEASIGDLPLLSPAESQLLFEWGDGGSVLIGPAGPAGPPGICLHELFLAQAARAPEAEALVAGGERLTYGELALRAGRLARRLRELGVGPDERVGVCLGRSAGLVVALLAVLEAGGAYVPLDAAYPRERLALMLEDSGARLLLTESRLRDRLPETGCPTLLLDPSGWPEGEVEAAASPVEPAARRPISPISPISPIPGNLAYLIYTSGSTGRPKAVAIEHRSAVALALWAREVFPAEDLAGVLAATSVSFDLSVFEIFVPLAWGGRVILADNALALAGLPEAGEVRLVNTVPSAMAELVRQGAVPLTVRTVNLAGEPLKRTLVAALHEKLPETRVLNLYGPSEDTTYSTWALQARREGEPGIGRPLPGTAARVLDREGRRTPAGVPGELYLGGEGLARGYLGRPHLTAERFVPDPWAVQPGERLYRTGDLVRYRRHRRHRRDRRDRPDGELEYLGRLDHQVKIRGFRIELGEIESALLGHPEVRDAVVVARDDGAAGTRLVAYVVPRESSGADLPVLLPACLAESLPPHMVPSAFVVLPTLPLTPNGKVDRKALPAPDWREGATLVAPRTPLEEVLAGFFADALGLETVGVEDSFFRLGGHSLLATQLVSKVRGAFQVELPLRRLFETPTVAALAATVAAAEAKPGQSERIARALLKIRKLAAERQLAVAGEEA